MKLYGWCWLCRRIRLVSVQHWDGKGAPVGVCDDCKGEGA